MSDTTVSVRTESEIEKVLSKCDDSAEYGTEYAVMTYEDGVRYAIQWIFSRDAEDLFE